MNVVSYDHFIDGKDNMLNSILEELNQGLEAEEEEKERAKAENLEPKPKLELFPKEEVKERKERKPKKLAPEYVFIFDDLGSDLQHASIAQLCKVSRHYKAKLIFSSQYIHDLSNSAIKNIDYALIFRSFNKEKLLSLYEGLDLSITFETFEKIYQDATEERFHFLYVDCREGTFRKDFNKEYILNVDD